MNSNSQGYTLLESLVAMAILGIALAGIIPGIQSYMDANTVSEERSNSVAAAQEVMEALRQVDPAALPTSGRSPVQSIEIGHHEYEVQVQYCQRSEYCNSTSRHILLEVGFAGKNIYKLESVYTRLR